MIWVLTVHHPVGHWIAVQRRQLDLSIGAGKYKVAAMVPEGETGTFEHEIWGVEYDGRYPTLPPPSRLHARNLDAVTEMALPEIDDGDILVVLDGDAFPIGDDFVKKLRGWLERWPALTIAYHRRMVHCSFFACRAGFYRQRLDVGWGPVDGGRGITFRDTNGALNKQLTVGRHRWKALERSNAFDPLPPHFGVYGEAIYHHGMGFRDPSMNPRDRHLARLLFGSVEAGEAWVLARKRELRDQLFVEIERNPRFYEALL